MRECKTPGATYSFNPANNYQDDGWRLHVTVNYPTGKLGGLNNDMFGSRSPHGLYRDIVHDAMEWATAEIQRLNAIYCKRTDCLPRHPDYEAQRSAAVAEIEHERRPFPPDLRAQGEPVAWAYEELRTRTFDEWEPALSYDRPGPASWFRNIEPLFKQAPAAPRPGSGVTVEEIAAIILKKAWSDGEWDAVVERASRHPGGQAATTVNRCRQTARAILTLFAQAPRDGGETQGGWQPIAEVIEEAKANDGWIYPRLFGKWRPWGFEQWVGQCDDGDIWLGRTGGGGCYDCDVPDVARPLPTPPSGVETIRQDMSGGK